MKTGCDCGAAHWAAAAYQAALALELIRLPETLYNDRLRYATWIRATTGGQAAAQWAAPPRKPIAAQERVSTVSPASARVCET